MLEDVGIDPDAAMDRRPHEFSGGQAQRISIARALILDPKVIICDEPVSALDVSVQAQVLNLLEDLKVKYGISLIFIAHDLAVVKNIADRVVVMYLGKVCEVGAARRPVRAPAAPVHRDPDELDPGHRPVGRPARGDDGLAASCRRPIAPPSGAASGPAARRPPTCAPRRSRCCARWARASSSPATSRSSTRRRTAAHPATPVAVGGVVTAPPSRRCVRDGPRRSA